MIKRILLFLLLPVCLFAEQYINSQSPHLWTVDNRPLVSQYFFDGTGGAIVPDEVGSNDFTVTALGDSVFYAPADIGNGLKSGNYAYSTVQGSGVVVGYQPDTFAFNVCVIQEDVSFTVTQSIARIEDDIRENRIIFSALLNTKDTIRVNFEGTNNIKEFDVSTGASDGDTLELAMYGYFDGDSLKGYVYLNGAKVGTLITERFDANLDRLFIGNNHTVNAPFLGTVSYLDYCAFDGKGFTVEQGSTWVKNAYLERANKRQRQIDQNTDLSIGAPFLGMNFVSASFEAIDITTLLNDVASDVTGGISAWINTVGAAGNEMIFTISDASQSRGIYFYLDSSERLNLRAAPAGTGLWHLRTIAAIPTGQLVHVFITQDGANPILYVNGIAVAQSFIISTNKAIWFNDMVGFADNIHIADINFNGGGESDFFNGIILDVRYYTEVLTAPQVLKMATSGGLYTPYMPDGWWRLNEGPVGTTPANIRDYSIKGNTGTLISAPVYIRRD